MSVAIVDYGSGNLRSAAKAFERAGREAGIDAPIRVTADPAVVAAADRVVLPGVGAFADCRRGLDSVPGMIEAMEESALARGRPFLGICVGMQLLATVGREHGDHPGLDWIEGEVVPLSPGDPDLKIPHMGWNELESLAAHPVLEGLRPGAHAYFVHSYVFAPRDDAARLATADYGGPLAAAVGRDNLFGVQFHPEKSQATGLRMIANFLRWRP
jgi:imidazole glycerol-phosphate synthase subunit HisH